MERSEVELRNRLELEWLDHQMGQNFFWSEYRNTQRTYVAPHKKFVLWEVKDGTPVIVDLLKVGAVGINWHEGLTYVLESQKSQSQYTITARPSEHGLGVFLWIPAFADARFTPIKYEAPETSRRLTLPIMYRSRHIPTRLVDGARYFSSVKDFKAQWPGIF